MNNKASKRLLAASVASLMLVVAFCGFTYAGDDADAVPDPGEYGNPYVKKVIVANGSTVEFDILTTQYLGAGYGITHSAEWFCWFDGGWVPLSSSDSTPSNFELFTTYVTFGPTKGSTNTFSVTGAQCGTISVDLKYKLTSSVMGSTPIEQEIFYRMDVTVAATLPTGSFFGPIKGYVGVGFEKSALTWGSINTTGLKYYAKDLPDGLSMDILGTISGVPKESGDFSAIVSISNGTGNVTQVTVSIHIEDRIASLDATITGAIKLSDDRYLVKDGQNITIVGTVSGYENGSMKIDSKVNLSSSDITYDDGTKTGTTGQVTVSGTGEGQIAVIYSFDMDGDSTMETITDYITVVIVDVVEDATTGMGLVAGSP